MYKKGYIFCLIAGMILLSTVPAAVAFGEPVHNWRKVKVNFPGVFVYDSHDPTGKGEYLLGAYINGQNLFLMREDTESHQNFQLSDKSVYVAVPEKGGTLKIVSTGTEFDDGATANLPDIPGLAAIPKIGPYLAVTYGIVRAVLAIPNPNDGIGIISREYSTDPQFMFTWQVPWENSARIKEFMIREFYKSQVHGGQPDISRFGEPRFERADCNTPDGFCKTIRITGVSYANLDIRADIRIDDTRTNPVMTIQSIFCAFICINGIPQQYFFFAKPDDWRLNVFENRGFGIGYHEDLAGSNGNDEDSVGDYILRNFIEEVGRPITSNGFFIQSNFGIIGNFEMVVPNPSGGLAFYWRDNDNPNLPWNGPFTFGTEAGVVDSVSLIQSNFGSPGAFELVARTGDRLVYFWRDPGPPFNWHGPLPMPSGGSSVAGNPALIQSTFGGKGHFDLVVPRADAGFNYYWRDNDKPNLPWNGPYPFATDAGKVDSVALLQGTFGINGNYELIARIGDRLALFWREDAPPFNWHGPYFLQGSGFTGNPTLIQSNHGQKGHYDLIVPRTDGGFAYFWRDNDNQVLPWEGPFTFGTEAGVVDSVSLIQSNFGSPGAFELVARTGDRLVYFWRDPGPPFNWHGPLPLPNPS